MKYLSSIYTRNKHNIQNYVKFFKKYTARRIKCTNTVICMYK